MITISTRISIKIQIHNSEFPDGHFKTRSHSIYIFASVDMYFVYSLSTAWTRPILEGSNSHYNCTTSSLGL